MFSRKNAFSFVDKDEKWCQWTVFLGDNNTGKTNLLKAISMLEPTKDIYFSDNEKMEEITCLGVNIFPYSNVRIYNHKGTFSLTTIPRTRSQKNQRYCDLSYESNSPFSLSFSYSDDSDLLDLKIYGYGVNRTITSKGISVSKENILNSDNLLNQTELLNFQDWLFQLDYAAKNTSSPDNQIKAQ
ncbi:MAG: ATP-binding protein [Tannerellaceae bacterium]|nr:ATP-binding protein [Tannerellaceae bacterium]